MRSPPRIARDVPRMGADMKTQERAHYDYRFSGQLPREGSYTVEISGPVRASTIRHVIAVLEMTAKWLDEDEAREGPPVEVRHVRVMEECN